MAIQAPEERVAEIEALLQATVDAHKYRAEGKTSDRVLAPAATRALIQAGYDVDMQDTRMVLPRRVACWRYGAVIEETTKQRKIDMVVYKDASLVALIESEQDISDINFTGQYKRYFVQSLASNANGEWFASYKSIERMAIAAFQTSGLDPTSIRSDAPSHHNPHGVAMFLILACGWNDRNTRARAGVIEPRLASLGCKIIARGLRASVG